MFALKIKCRPAMERWPLASAGLETGTEGYRAAEQRQPEGLAQKKTLQLENTAKLRFYRV